MSYELSEFSKQIDRQFEFNDIPELSVWDFLLGLF